MAAVALMGATLATGGYSAARTRLLSGAAWLPSAQVGQVTLLDGASAEVAGQVQVASPGAGLDVVQQGSNAYAVNRSAGSIRRVDGATFQVSAAVTPIPGAGEHLQAFAASTMVYALDTGRGVLTTADPATLASRSAPLPLAARVTPQAAALDTAGRLWLLDTDSGDLVWMYRGQRHVRQNATTAGAGLLAVVNGSPVVVDTRRRTAQLIDPASGNTRHTTQLDLRSDDRVAVSGSAHSSRLYVVAARGELTICDLTAASCGNAVPLAAAGGDPGAAVEANDRLFIPDYASGRVWVIDLRRMAVLATPQVLSPATRFQLLEHDGVVFFNDPNSARAGVIRLDGGVHQIAKYDPKDPNKGVTGTGSVGQPPPARQPKPPTNHPPSTQPSQPTTNPPANPPGGQQNSAPLSIVVSNLQPIVNEDVGLSVTTSRAPSPVTAHWTFGDGQTADGLNTTHRWTSAQTFQVSVQATFPNGGSGITSVPIRVVARPVGTVAVSIGSAGGGTVTSQPAGISCPPTCSADFAPGTAVTLAAAPGNGFNFGTWSGACNGANPSCPLTVNAGQTNVTANFVAATPTTATLTVKFAGTGSGHVTGNGVSSGLNCPPTCSVTLPLGARANLTETPASDHSDFRGWDRDCGNTGAEMCLITMTADTTVTVTYAAVFLLDVFIDTNNPNADPNCCGIAMGNGGTCEISCTKQPMLAGTAVTFQMVSPNGQGVPTGWSGDCTGGPTVVCRLTMTKDMTVHGNFAVP